MTFAKTKGKLLVALETIKAQHDMAKGNAKDIYSHNLKLVQIVYDTFSKEQEACR